MTLENQVKEFYGNIKFPGLYELDDLLFYKNYHGNPFIQPYREQACRANSILDIGCGTGFITNLIAFENNKTKITAIDFSDSINVAKNFSSKNNIENITYKNMSILDFDFKNKFDLIISNGVIHHIPKYVDVFKSLNESGANTLVLGLYNTYGKIFKNIVSFRNSLLHKDQLDVPFQVSFTNKQVIKFLDNYRIEQVYPSFNTRFVDFSNLLNNHNGGLTIYVFKLKG